MQCIHEAFGAQASLTPDAVALEFEAQRITYRQLDQRAAEIASVLCADGVAPGALVALLVERSPDMVAAMLGILKAGGAYVPLDPSLPEKRLQSMLADARPLVVLTQRDMKAKLPQHDARVILLEDIAAGEDVAFAARLGQADDLAYVIYTSGSTGQPKGVQIQHASVLNMLGSMERRPGFTASDRILALTTIAFDISVLEIFLPLTRGGCVILAGGDMARDGAALARLIGQSRITVMQATPATLQMLLDAGWAGEPGLKILCGGEALSSGLAAQLLAGCDTLWNMYGPTETTVWSAVAKVEAGQPVVVGRPIANTRLYVLDAALQLVPVGVPGELFIGGCGLARGYLNRPELNAERFIADPFTGQGARMYRTGDLVKRTPHGTFEFLGRIDHQVKIRGYRIELGDIESALAQHPDIGQSVTIAYHGADGLQNLAAYFIAAPGRTVAAQELRRFLSERLPSYMVPAAFVVMPAFPLSPSGKIDRKALPPPELAPAAQDQFVEPKTPTEQALAAIWRDMLNLKRVGLTDNFFNLGGHSLLALRTINEINKTLDVNLNVPDFFQRPTIGELAVVLAPGSRIKAARVVALQRGKAGLPIYFMGARPDEYRLAQLIREDRSVFLVDALLPAGWISAVATEDTKVLPPMEAIGELFGRTLFEHVGTRPCVIIGYSLGGKIAYEAAQSLHRAGGRAAFVMLLDARAFAWSKASRLATVWRSLWMGLAGAFHPGKGESFGRSLGKVLGHAWRFATWQLLSIPAAIRYRFEIAQHRKLATESDVVPVEEPSGYFDSEGRPIGMFVVHRMAKLVGEGWRPRPIDTAGALIRAKAAVDMLPGFDRTHGWQPLFRQSFEVVQAEGDHVSILTQAHAKSLSKQMNSLLDRYGTVPKTVDASSIERRRFTPAPRDMHGLNALAAGGS